MSKEIKRVYYCESTVNGKTNWKLTTNQLEAQNFQICDLATSDDLDDWGCVGGLFSDSYLITCEGIFEWQNNTYIDPMGYINNCGEYEQVLDIKAIILDILEDMDLMETEEYEICISWTQWKSWKFIEQYDLNYGNILCSIREFNEKYKKEKIRFDAAS